MNIGVVHPGEMGAAIGAELRAAGHTVLWASSGRSGATAERAAAAGLEDVETLEELQGRSNVVISLCPPHAAVDIATAFHGFAGMYVEANAVSPATTRAIAGIIGRCVDGGVIGSPPHSPGPTRLYLSGAEAPDIAALFEGTNVDARVLSDDLGDASALKMAYAAWTKGSSALLLAVRALARAQGVEAALLDEWEQSLPELSDRSSAAASSALRKGWRWVGEMEEIAATFAAAGLPDGFHRAAAEIYTRSRGWSLGGTGDHCRRRGCTAHDGGVAVQADDACGRQGSVRRESRAGPRRQHAPGSANLPLHRRALQSRDRRGGRCLHHSRADAGHICAREEDHPRRRHSPRRGHGCLLQPAHHVDRAAGGQGRRQRPGDLHQPGRAPGERGEGEGRCDRAREVGRQAPLSRDRPGRATRA